MDWKMRVWLWWASKVIKFPATGIKSGKEGLLDVILFSCTTAPKNTVNSVEWMYHEEYYGENN